VGGEKVNRILFSHNSDEWETPQALFDELNSKYGFTLDPCATNKNKKVNYYFNKKQNGLSQSPRN
jgi:site-specific DNA-methyltransferase (adenine-specific)